MEKQNRTRTHKLIAKIYYSICIALLLTVPCSAYIDPSAMTYIIQLVAGMAIAAGAAFGFYFRKIKRAFSRIGNKDKVYVGETDADDDDDFGLGDYPVLDCDRYDDDILGGEYDAPSGVDADIEEVYTDRYSESGLDLLKENARLRQLLLDERGKSAALEKKLRTICANKNTEEVR